MDKIAVFNHYSAVLDNLLDNSVFFDTFLQSPYLLEYNDVSEIAPSNITLASGVTRACLIDDNYDWVVKFDIAVDGNGESGCEREMYIYDEAQKRGLGQYFTEVAYLGTYRKTIHFYPIWQIENTFEECLQDYYPEDFELQFHRLGHRMEMEDIEISIPLYGYRRANEYDCGVVDEQTKSEAQRFASPLRSRNMCVATAFIRDYGLAAYKKMSHFCLEWKINDLHCNNIGGIDGKIVLLDYSGFIDECEDYSSEDWLRGTDVGEDYSHIFDEV